MALSHLSTTDLGEATLVLVTTNTANPNLVLEPWEDARKAADFDGDWVGVITLQLGRTKMKNLGKENPDNHPWVSHCSLQATAPRDAEKGPPSSGGRFQ